MTNNINPCGLTHPRAALTHQPCGACGSSDALSQYSDGHTYCFSCGAYTKPEGSGGATPATLGSLIPHTELEYRPLTSRGISIETCRKFNYGTLPSRGLQVANYLNDLGAIMYQKTRNAQKEFSVLKSAVPGLEPFGTLLYGRHLWGNQGGRALVITEGEVDCLSAYEALGPLGVHVVAVSSGAQGALACLKQHLAYITRYQRVYLAFDNDGPGRKATEEVLNELGSPIMYYFTFPLEMKDLNDVLKANGRAAVVELYNEAKQWKPVGILTPEEILRLAVEVPKRGFDWPWKALNDTTFGISPGLILVAAGSGVGKTTWFKQVEAHCYKQGKRIGVIHLEESSRGTINGLLSLLKGRDFHTPESTVTEDERLGAFNEILEGNQLVLFDKQVGFDEDLILGTIRYMVQGLGCDVVFLDHLTAITDQYDKDVNQRTRNLVVKLGKLVTSLEFPLLAVSHLRKAEGKSHEEGGRVHLDDLLGAGAIKQWAEHVYALERDNQSEDPSQRNLSTLRDLKNRPLGEHTGNTIGLVYCPETFTLEQTNEIRKENSNNDHGKFRTKEATVPDGVLDF